MAPDSPAPDSPAPDSRFQTWLGRAAPVFFACLVLWALSVMFPPVHRLFHRIPGVAFFFPDTASGTITASQNLGGWTMHVDECLSGQRFQYHGASFFDHAQPRLGGRIVLEPDGINLLLVNTPADGNSQQIDSRGCQRWDVDLQQSGNTINDIYILSGHARFDCRFDDSTHVTGDLQFRSCH